MSRGCIIVSNTATGICTYVMGVRTFTEDMGNVTTAPREHLTISGSLSVWILLSMQARFVKKICPEHEDHHGKLVEGDVAKCNERAFRIVASGPFGMHFFSAAGIVGEN
ncbi:hypothetical protein KIN20_029530 [Parelaphostrongylus tenuis]|uniref:Uncharacterized protein n=1 Tax=Parelaphostrongylus tenuis TaxID=148309 RepID=A0AAD5WFP5_PARTN|nr:hypothetical protein KIN20_029530 [Parelaphostrongylus tenuis]